MPRWSRARGNGRKSGRVFRADSFPVYAKHEGAYSADSPGDGTDNANVGDRRGRRERLQADVAVRSRHGDEQTETESGTELTGRSRYFLAWSLGLSDLAANAASL